MVGIVALAPWLPPGEPRVRLRDRRLLVVHGTADRWTDPRASAAYVNAARAQGAAAHWHAMEGHGHFMLRRARTWKRLTTDFVRDCLRAPRGGQAGQPPAPNLPHHA